MFFYFAYGFQTNAKHIDIKMIYELYTNHIDVFKQDAYKVQSTNPDINNLNDLFFEFLNKTQQVESHNLWRCNRMNPLRLLRKLIARPDRLPSTGMSVERYLAIDTADGPSYTIPNTDCSNVFIVQLMGTRQIILRPTTECQQQCRTISVRLPESYVCE